MWNRFFLPLLLLTQVACGPASNQAPLEPAFFDLAGYMEQQIKELAQRQPAAVKAISLDGKVETQRLTQLNFAEELSLFLQADINKPAWREEYSIDTIRSGGALEALRYQARQDHLTTRELRIDFREGVVNRVYVKEHVATVLAQSNRELIYLPADGYQILSLQQHSGDTTALEVRVNWVE